MYLFEDPYAPEVIAGTNVKAFISIQRKTDTNTSVRDNPRADGRVRVDLCCIYLKTLILLLLVLRERM